MGPLFRKVNKHCTFHFGISQSPEDCLWKPGEVRIPYCEVSQGVVIAFW